MEIPDNELPRVLPSVAADGVELLLVLFIGDGGGGGLVGDGIQNRIRFERRVLPLDDDGSRPGRRIPLLPVSFLQLGVGRTSLLIGQPQVGDGQRFAGGLKGDGVVPFFKVEKQRCYVIPLGIADKAVVLPLLDLQLRGPDVVALDVGFPLPVGIVPIQAVKHQGLRFLVGILAVDFDLAFHRGAPLVFGYEIQLQAV